MLRDPETVIAAYSQMRGIDRDVLCTGTGKSPVLVWPRHEVAWLLRQMTGLSLAQIGEMVGGRDPTTVQHSINRVADRIAEDPDFRRSMLALVEGASTFGSAREVKAMDAATRIVRRAVNGPQGRTTDVELLGLAVLTVASVLHSPELTDAEARAAAIQVIQGHGDGHVATH